MHSVPPNQSKLSVYDPEIKYDFEGEKYSFDADLMGVSGNKAPPIWTLPKDAKIGPCAYKSYVISYIEEVVKLVHASPGTTLKIFPRKLRETGPVGLCKLTGSDFKIASRGLYHLRGIEVTHIYSGPRRGPLDYPKRIVLEYSKDNPILFPYSAQEPRENSPTVDFAFTFADSEIRLPCHKHVLSSRSDYFDKLFTGGFKEGASNELVMPQGTKPHVINMMLDFLYTGQAPIDSLARDDLMQLLELSKLYGLDYLAQTCASRLRAFINENTVEELLVFAQEFNVKDVKSGCQKFLSKNLDRENAQDIHRLAKEYDMPDLVKICEIWNPQLKEEEKEKVKEAEKETDL